MELKLRVAMGNTPQKIIKRREDDGSFSVIGEPHISIRGDGLDFFLHIYRKIEIMFSNLTPKILFLDLSVVFLIFAILSNRFTDLLSRYNG